MINFIMNIEGVYRKTTWKFGPKLFVFYKMKEIDSIITHNQRPGKPSVLELLIFTPMSKDSLPIYVIPVIEELTKRKWNFLLVSFVFWIVLHLSCMMVCYEIPKQFMNTLTTYSNHTGSLQNVSSVDVIKHSDGLSAMTVYLFMVVPYTIIFLFKDVVEILWFLLKYIARGKFRDTVYKAP